MWCANADLDSFYPGDISLTRLYFIAIPRSMRMICCENRKQFAFSITEDNWNLYEILRENTNAKLTFSYKCKIANYLQLPFTTGLQTTILFWSHNSVLMQRQ